MATERVMVDFGRAYPVFPLQGAVLLPQAVMPLHVFEPRYRRMVSDVLDSHGMIAMALFRGEGTPAERPAGPPPLRTFVCLGQIREYERMRDGRYVLLLQGLCRARVERELVHTPYRRVRLLPVEEADPGEDQLVDYRRRIGELLKLKVSGDGPGKPLIAAADYKDVSTPVVVDLAIAAVCREATQQYRLLSQPDVRLRAEWVIHQMEILTGQQPDLNSRN
jgi:Lon protease-like protein